MNPLVNGNTRTILVAREGGEMPSCGGEDGVKQGRTPTGSLRNDQSEGLSWVTDVKLESSVIIEGNMSDHTQGARFSMKYLIKQAHCVVVYLFGQ